MRLTNSLREEILNSISSDTPRVTSEHLDRLAVEIALSILPDDVRKVYPKNKAVFSATSYYIKCDVSRSGLHVYAPTAGASDLVKDKLNANKDFMDATSKCISDQKIRLNALQQVKTMLNAVSNTNDLIKICPEFEKYVPTKTTAKTLPAVTTTIDALSKAGWPVTKEN